MKRPKNSTLILSQDDIRIILKTYGLNAVMDQLIDRMTTSISQFDPEHTTIPARAGFHYELPNTGLVEWMPIYNHGEQVVIKLVGYHPMNPNTNGFPTIVSTISSYDTSSGHLKALTDGVLLTALRTGAASAVASKMLAHPESKTLGLIGCGAQSITQLHALSRIFNIEKVLIYDIDPDTTSSFGKRIESLNLEVDILSSSIPEIVESSDILCTATSIDVGAGPLFDNLETKPHLHINAVGSDFPGKTEVPINFLKNSFVCPDFLSQAVIEGECQKLAKEDIGPDWVTVIRDIEKYSYVRNQRSVFDSTGWALEDQVVLDLFLEYAANLGLGQPILIENVPQDAKSPYEFLEVKVPSLEV
jgi:L-lysine cyclodeaminase